LDIFFATNGADSILPIKPEITLIPPITRKPFRYGFGVIGKNETPNKKAIA
jgi:hypothetical protein